MSKHHGKRPVANVHVNFTIVGDGDIATGAVLPAEARAAIERFIRWHERQVAIGRQLLTQLSHAVEDRPMVDEQTTDDVKADEAPTEQTPSDQADGGGNTAPAEQEQDAGGE